MSQCSKRVKRYHQKHYTKLCNVCYSFTKGFIPIDGRVYKPTNQLIYFPIPLKLLRIQMHLTTQYKTKFRTASRLLIRCHLLSITLYQQMINQNQCTDMENNILTFINTFFTCHHTTQNKRVQKFLLKINCNNLF